ncbi:hypothetical protein AMR76_06345 [Vibrio furnissii]|uniref:Uncharacterized protein n=1 Tax=Vibrio furnissii TaxID=29494 RepID=A0A0Q2SGE4_VIBFU|nr:hypothetical protein AMR76_06345 [Vibrio furnissii]
MNEQAHLFFCCVDDAVRMRKIESRNNDVADLNIKVGMLMNHLNTVFLNDWYFIECVKFRDIMFVRFYKRQYDINN